MNKTGLTHYSQEVPGTPMNHGFVVRFDLTDGYLGVSQRGRDSTWTNRVLLSPDQIQALLAFVRLKPEAP